MNSPRYHLPPPLLQVAMAVGYLDPIPVERVRAARRQVLVVLTASWQVWGSVRKCGVCGAREGSPEAGDGGADCILAGVGKCGVGVSESAPCLMRTAAGVTVPFRGTAVWGISR